MKDEHARAIGACLSKGHLWRIWLRRDETGQEAGPYHVVTRTRDAESAARVASLMARDEPTPRPVVTRMEHVGPAGWEAASRAPSAPATSRSRAGLRRGKPGDSQLRRGKPGDLQLRRGKLGDLQLRRGKPGDLQLRRGKPGAQDDPTASRLGGTTEDDAS